MTNRRRSERYPVSLPIWLKDAHGGERTRTVDVSAHGLAVVTTQERPLRQYVELEIDLSDPEVQIAVTAVVARRADVPPTEPDGSGGLGLDFFLFDAQAKKHWQSFLQRLSTEAVSVSPAPQPPKPPLVEDLEETPTFIIKPRDLGRLWAFYRGELAKGLARIETPVAKAVGLPVELLVVHPTSQAEWVLAGRVSTTQPTRGGRTELQIDLGRPDGDLKAAFRNFVATGQGMIEEEVSLEFDTGASENGVTASPSVNDRDSQIQRIESVVIDLDEMDRDAPVELLVRKANGELPIEAPAAAEDPTAVSQPTYEEPADEETADDTTDGDDGLDVYQPADDLVAAAESPSAASLSADLNPNWDAEMTLSEDGIEEATAHDDSHDDATEDKPSPFLSASNDESGDDHQSIESIDLLEQREVSTTDGLQLVAGPPEDQDDSLNLAAEGLVRASPVDHAEATESAPAPAAFEANAGNAQEEPIVHEERNVQELQDDRGVREEQQESNQLTPVLHSVSEADALQEPLLPPSPNLSAAVTPPALEALPVAPVPPPSAIPPSYETKNERPAVPAPPESDSFEQPSAPSLSLSSRNIFAAFFEEAEAAEPSLVPPPAGSSVAAPEISERIYTEDPRLDPSTPYTPPRAARLAPQATAPVRGHSKPPPVPNDNPVRVVRGAPVQAPLDEPLYSFSEEEEEDHELPVQAPPTSAPASGRAPPPPPARAPIASPAVLTKAVAGGRSIEEGAARGHRNVQTAGIDPELDREIALARARMVRSPHSVTACYRLSALLLKKGKHDGLDEAAESLRQVVKMEPNHPGAHHKLAEILAREGRYSEASEHLARARRLGYQVDPDLELVVQEALRRPSSVARE